MKYIIAEVNGSTKVIEAITADPTGYLSSFEPIDVIEGRTIAWDENGNLFHFSSNQKIEKNSRGIPVVNVGVWDEGEPHMHKVAENQQNLLRDTLINYLSTSRVNFWQRLRRKQPPAQDYSGLSMDELIQSVEQKLMK